MLLTDCIADWEQSVQANSVGVMIGCMLEERLHALGGGRERTLERFRGLSEVGQGVVIDGMLELLVGIVGGLEEENGGSMPDAIRGGEDVGQRSDGPMAEEVADDEGNVGEMLVEGRLMRQFLAYEAESHRRILQGMRCAFRMQVENGIVSE